MWIVCFFSKTFPTWSIEHFLFTSFFVEIFRLRPRTTRFFARLTNTWAQFFPPTIECKFLYISCSTFLPHNNSPLRWGWGSLDDFTTLHQSISSGETDWGGGQISSKGPNRLNFFPPYKWLLLALHYCSSLVSPGVFFHLQFGLTCWCVD